LQQHEQSSLSSQQQQRHSLRSDSNAQDSIAEKTSSANPNNNSTTPLTTIKSLPSNNSIQKPLSDSRMAIPSNTMLTESSNASIGSTSKKSIADETILVESLYGDYQEALSHLNSNFLCTKNAHEIRKGILRYCYELAKGRQPKPEQKEELDKIFVESFLAENWINFDDMLSKFLIKHPSTAVPFLRQFHALLSFDARTTKKSKLEMRRSEIYLESIERFIEKYSLARR